MGVAFERLIELPPGCIAAGLQHNALDRDLAKAAQVKLIGEEPDNVFGEVRAARSEGIEACNYDLPVPMRFSAMSFPLVVSDGSSARSTGTINSSWHT